MPNQDPNQNLQSNPPIPNTEPVSEPIPPAEIPNTEQQNFSSSIPAHNDLPPLPDFMMQNDANTTQDITNKPQDDDNPTGIQTPPTPQVDSPTNESPGSAAPPDLPPMVASPKKKFGGKRIIATILGIFLLVGGIGAGIVLTQQQQLFQQKADEGTGYGAGCITGIHGTVVCGSTNVPYDPNNPPAGENSGYKSEEDAIWGCGGGNYNQGANGNYYCGSGGGGGGGGGGTNPTPTPGPTIVCQNVKAFKSDSVTALTSAELSALKAGDSISFCAFTESTTAKTVTFSINGASQAPLTPTGACMTARGTCFCSDPYVIPNDVATINISALLTD
jgi:hypothetical protein